MYIRRKVFSVFTDEIGEERLYSVNETILGGYEVEEEREFAKKEEDKIALEDIKSKRGIGRGLLTTDPASLIVSRKVAKKAANKADKEGASDVVIVEKAKSAGSKAGAGVGAVVGVGSTYLGAKEAKKTIKNLGNDYRFMDNNKTGKWIYVNAKKALRNKKFVGGLVAAAATSGAASGTLGGRLSASKMTRKRLEKRHDLEQKLKKEDNK